jgi:hypothetical protein
VAKPKTRKALGDDQGLRKNSSNEYQVVSFWICTSFCNVKSKTGLQRGLFALPFSGGINLNVVGEYE